MKTAKIIVLVLGIVILVLLGVLLFVPAAKGPTTSGPAVSADGHLTVSAPLPGALIEPPLHAVGSVTGGGWFFEAVFPVMVLDGDGVVLGQGQAHAEGEPGAWMTTGTVPFSATVNFSAPKYASGTVVFEKDNPSGLPQNAGELRVPVLFAAPSSSQGNTAGTGTVNGTVVLGPTCPVETNPPTPQCAPKPYQTIISISKNIERPIAFKTVQSNASGSFTVDLAPGEYDFYIENSQPYPRCAEAVATVTAGRTSDLTIRCDTGIR